MQYPDLEKVELNNKILSPEDFFAYNVESLYLDFSGSYDRSLPYPKITDDMKRQAIEAIEEMGEDGYPLTEENAIGMPWVYMGEGAGLYDEVPEPWHYQGWKKLRPIIDDIETQLFDLEEEFRAW